MKKGSKPKSTKIDQNRETYDDLEPKYQMAIEMKLRSFSYLDIAHHPEIKMSLGAVKSWFAQGGLLHDIYEVRKKERLEEIEERFHEVDRRIKELVPDALLAYEENIRPSKGKRRSWMAAESLLDRAGYKPTQTIELKTPAKVSVSIELDDPEQQGTSDPDQSVS